MASCLVPHFPAVMVALEHLKELDKQLREDAVAFSPEASLHLTEIISSITELEADRRAAHEHLEVETIENSKLRLQINKTRERTTQEIVADVAAARALNAEKKETLHKDLSTNSQLHETTVKRLEDLRCQNEALHPEREQLKAEHEALVAALNERITLKYGLQAKLDQTREQIEELRSCVASVEQDKVKLQQDMVLERQAFSAKTENLTREMEQLEGRIKQENQAIRRSRKELDGINEERQEAQGRLGELSLHVANLESSLERQAASRRQCETQLEAEKQKHQELRQQIETLKQELCDLRETLSAAVQKLLGEIATIEGKIEEKRTSKLGHQDSLLRVSEVLKQQQQVEKEVKAEHDHITQQFKRSKMLLDQRTSSIVRHQKEIKMMKSQMAELLAADASTRRVFQRHQEEVCENMEAEKRNIHRYEEEEKRLTGLLEETEKKQEEHVATMTCVISSTRERYQELREEEAAMRLKQPQSADLDLLRSYVARCEVEYRQKEAGNQQEIDQCSTEAENITRSNQEKQREVEEKEEELREVETQWKEEESRHRRLVELISQLKANREHLEVSIEDLKERTASLLLSREQEKAELEELRERYLDVLGRQALELRATERALYDTEVKLEQVCVENSRLRLCLRHMTEAVSAACQDKERYRQEAQQLQQHTKTLLHSLQEACREDVSAMQDGHSRDTVVLVSIHGLMERLETRRQQLAGFSTLLHRVMLDFSRRLGEKTSVKQQS